MRPELATLGSLPTAQGPNRPRPPPVGAPGRAEQHAGNCLVFTPAKVARRKLSRARVAPYLGCGWQWPRTRMIVGSNRRQQPRPSQIEPAQEHPPARPELLTSATHPPAVRAQPGVGSARPADWGGDSRVCPPLPLGLVHTRAPGSVFFLRQKIKHFVVVVCFLERASDGVPSLRLLVPLFFPHVFLGKEQEPGSHHAQ